MPRIATQTATRLEAPVSAQAAIEATSQFTFAPDLMAAVAWINSERARDHVKEDPRKQLASEARLFVNATGICRCHVENPASSQALQVGAATPAEELREKREGCGPEPR